MTGCFFVILGALLYLRVRAGWAVLAALFGLVCYFRLEPGEVWGGLLRAVHDPLFLSVLFLAASRELLCWSGLPGRLAALPCCLFGSPPPNPSPYFPPFAVLLTASAVLSGQPVIPILEAGVRPCLALALVMWLGGLIQTRPSANGDSPRERQWGLAVLGTWNWVIPTAMFCLLFMRVRQGGETLQEIALLSFFLALVYAFFMHTPEPERPFALRLVSSRAMLAALTVLAGLAATSVIPGEVPLPLESVLGKTITAGLPGPAGLAMLAFGMGLAADAILVVVVMNMFFLGGLPAEANPVLAQVMVVLASVSGTYLAPDAQPLSGAGFRARPGFLANLWRYKFVSAAHLAILAACLMMPRQMTGAVDWSALPELPWPW